MKRTLPKSKRKPFNQKGLNPKANPKFDQKSDVRAIARERVGTVKPSRPILPPTLRKKPKHKLPVGEDVEE
jgi:hypothetical protein